MSAKRDRTERNHVDAQCLGLDKAHKLFLYCGIGFELTLLQVRRYPTSKAAKHHKRSSWSRGEKRRRKTRPQRQAGSDEVDLLISFFPSQEDDAHGSVKDVGMSVKPTFFPSLNGTEQPSDTL